MAGWTLISQTCFFDPGPPSRLKAEVKGSVNSVKCGMCYADVHQSCIHMSNEDFYALKNDSEIVQWYFHGVDR